MGSGPKKTTINDQQSQQNQTQQSQTSNQQTNTGHTTQSQMGTSVTNPDLPSWYSDFLSKLPAGYSSLYNQAGQGLKTPLYGPQQEANFREQVGRDVGASRQDLLSQLASSGALNSGRAGQAQTQLALGGVGKVSDYLTKVPLLNDQARQSALAQQLGVLNSASGFKIPYGSTTTNNQTSIQDIINQLFGSSTTDSSGQTNSTSHSNQTEQTSGGLLNSVLAGLIQAGLSFGTGGLSNILGGGSFLTPKGQGSINV